MREMIKMVIVLTLLSCFSGGLLAAIRNNTQERIDYQQLKFVKGPAIRQILEGSSNDPINDRFKMTVDDTEKSFFVGVFDGRADTVAFETYGKGYGGDIGVMVGIDIQSEKLVGIGITTHAETPGMGSKAKDEPGFARQFRGMPVKDVYKVKTDSGEVDAVSGATITSRAVCVAVTKAAREYREIKPQLEEKLNAFNK